MSFVGVVTNGGGNCRSAACAPNRHHAPQRHSPTFDPQFNRYTGRSTLQRDSKWKARHRPYLARVGECGLTSTAGLEADGRDPLGLVGEGGKRGGRGRDSERHRRTRPQLDRHFQNIGPVSERVVGRQWLGPPRVGVSDQRAIAHITRSKCRRDRSVSFAPRAAVAQRRRRRPSVRTLRRCYQNRHSRKRDRSTGENTGRHTRSTPHCSEKFLGRTRADQHDDPDSTPGYSYDAGAQSRAKL